MNGLRLDRLSIMLAAIALYTGQSWAATWEQSVSAKISTEYDTNPVMTPANTDGAWRALLEPSYTLAGIFDKNEVKTGLALQIERSSNETVSPARDSPTAFLDWLHHIDEGEFGMSAKYAEIATRDAGIDATGLAHLANTRTSRTVAGKFEKGLNERSTLSADASYEKVYFNGPGYINYDTRSANLLLNYAWSELSTPFFKASYADYNPADGSPISRFASGVLGLSWKFSDSIEGTLHAGKYQLTGKEKLGTLGGATLQFTGEQNQLIFSAMHRVVLSGLGGFIAVDEGNGNWSHALSERSKTGIDLLWQRLFFFPIVIERSAAAWLEYDLSSYWGMRTYYRRHLRDIDGIGGASSNIIGVTFAYTHPDF